MTRKLCTCTRRPIAPEDWAALPECGYAHYEPELLELRNCECRSTVSLTITDAEAPAALDRWRAHSETRHAEICYPGDGLCHVQLSDIVGGREVFGEGRASETNAAIRDALADWAESRMEVDRIRRAG